jgi:uracil-DNA glycosylase
VNGEERAHALAEVQQRMRSCRLCLDAGYDVFPRAIFSGAATAHMMVIGQAPGITEKEAGRPFNAGSGTRLFQWLAIQLFYPANRPLSDIIGTQKQVDGRWIVPLPHPSGASRWHQSEENRQLVQQAIGLIQFHYAEIFKSAADLFME